MALTPEKKVKNRAAKILKDCGVYFFYPTTAGYGRSGVPDIVCCWQGKFIAIECKANGNVPTALQEREMRNIREAGGKALVIDEKNVAILKLMFG